MTTYESAGVRRSLGDRASTILYEAAKQTWANREGRLGEVIVPFDDFSGLRAVDASSLPPGTLMNLGFDGVGTKVEIAERMRDHSTVAHDLFAMVCDDAVIRGAEPVLIGSILDINALADDEGDFLHHIEALAQGYVEAAALAGVAVVNGELAELGSRIGGHGPFCYNWGASVLWFARKDRVLTGKEPQVGELIVAFREKGFRSNGLSLTRKVLSDTYGADWHKADFQGNTLGAQVLHPSQIYSHLMVDLMGGLEGEPKAKIHGASHITGGGIPGKVGRMLLASGFGAKLDALFTPNEVMLHCQEVAGVTDREAYETWNMGQGMVVVTPEPDKVLAVAANHQIEAQVVGHVIEAPEIMITSQGFHQKGEKLGFAL